MFEHSTEQVRLKKTTKQTSRMRQIIMIIEPSADYLHDSNKADKF